MSETSGLPPEVEAELNPLLDRVIVLARPRPKHARALAEAVRDVWIHGADTALGMIAAEIGLNLDMSEIRSRLLADREAA